MARKIVFSPLASRHKRSVPRGTYNCSATVPNVHFQFYQRDVTDGTRSPWTLPVVFVSQSVQVVNVASEIAF